MKKYEIHTKLQDGTPILIRPLRPEDKESIKEGFERISLKPGETKTVTFNISPEQLQFYNLDMERVVEPGEFEIMVGTNSVDLSTVLLRVE